VSTSEPPAIFNDLTPTPLLTRRGKCFLHEGLRPS
jgi:hypothetical protein